MRRWLLWTLVGVVAVLAVAAAAGGWLLTTSVRARDHLTEAGRLVDQLRGQLDRGDRTSASRTLSALRGESQAAREATEDPLWRVGRRLPFIGDDLAATAGIADVLNDLTERGLPELVHIDPTVDVRALIPRNGRVDLSRMGAVAIQFATVSVPLREARARVAAIPTAGLAPELRDAVTDLRSGLDRALALTATAAPAARVVPAMLGAGGTRTYLLLVRPPVGKVPTGSVPFVALRVREGALAVAETGSLAVQDRPRSRGVRFAVVAAGVRQAYKRSGGALVHGVIAVDPVALTYLLRATGPVTVPGAPPIVPALTAANAQQVMAMLFALVPDQSVRDRYVSAAAGSVLGAAASGKAPAKRVVGEIARALKEHRIRVWSADPAEQRLLEGTALGG